MNDLSKFLLPLVVSFLIVAFSTPIIIYLANKLGLVDDPKTNKHPKVLHKEPTPRSGGIPVFMGVLLASLLFLPLDSHLIGILLGALLLVVVGVLDDKWNLSPYLRLVTQVVAAGIPIATGIGISYITSPVGGTIDLSHPQIIFQLLGETRSIWILSDLFALLWIVTLMNFINMGAKGLPGQMSGVVAISAFVITLLSLRYSADITEWPVIILSAITAGAFLGFLPWHIYPQRIMPGFSGSTLAGYLLAVLAILTTTKVGTIIVVLGIPIIDTSYTIVRRILSGKSPVWGDRGHLHHKLVDMGMKQEHVSMLYWGGTGGLGLIALGLSPSNKLYIILGLACAMGCVLLWINNRQKQL